ncbi:hypothetical protein [Kangiella shandongensis]|uniref:hypothetical protein n=1 Tax=Kangiella shandongensis TaxID=2763258 RepID=UPI001CC02B47|nr:hypothetical protein [Kangiella shandongensis]
MKKHSLEDLPVDIELDVAESGGLGTSIFLLLSFIGIGLILVGGYFIIWGPERVSYSLPDIEFFFKAYPGPIASMGFILVAISNAIRNQMDQKHLQKIDKQLSDQMSFSEDELPEGKLLNIAPLDSGRFRLELVDAPEEMSQEVAQPKEVEQDSGPVVKK